MAEIEITPRCAGGENIFISSEGWLLPCCYAHIFLRRTMAFPARFNDADHWFRRNLDLFDTNRRPVAEIVADPRWEELRRSWSDDTAPSICWRICGMPRDMGFKDTSDVRGRDRTFIKLGDPPPVKR